MTLLFNIFVGICFDVDLSLDSRSLCLLLRKPVDNRDVAIVLSLAFIVPVMDVCADIFHLLNADIMHDMERLTFCQCHILCIVCVMNDP